MKVYTEPPPSIHGAAQSVPEQETAAAKSKSGPLPTLTRTWAFDIPEVVHLMYDVHRPPDKVQGLGDAEIVPLAPAFL